MSCSEVGLLVALDVTEGVEVPGFVVFDGLSVITSFVPLGVAEGLLSALVGEAVGISGVSISEISPDVGSTVASTAPSIVGFEVGTLGILLFSVVRGVLDGSPKGVPVAVCVGTVVLLGFVSVTF